MRGALPFARAIRYHRVLAGPRRHGTKGVLEYVGIDIDTLARNATFEETVFLLWNRRLPTVGELSTFKAKLRAAYRLPDPVLEMIGHMPADAVPMHALRTLVSALALYDPEAEDNSPEAVERKAIALLARVPALIAAFDRHRKGLDIVEPDDGLHIAENFLLMLNGTPATPTMAQSLDVCLILHADHGFNASTFAALVTTSTLSDLYSSITTAIGTLKGPLHGGANEAVMHMLKEIGSLENVEPYIRGKLERKDVLEADRRGHGQRGPLRDEPPDRGDHGGGGRVPRDLPERRLLFGDHLLLPRPGHRPVHADVRPQPRGGVGGSLHRAAQRQQAHPASLRLRGAPRGPVHPHRSAGLNPGLIEACMSP
jgi:citrate synthase